MTSEAARNEIAALILSKIVAGTLPNASIKRARTGFGTDRVCHGCDQRIKPTEFQDELEVARTVVLRLHRQCFTVWQEEMAKLGREIGGGCAELSATIRFRRLAADQAEFLAASVNARVLTWQTRELSRDVRRRTQMGIARARANRIRGRGGLPLAT